MSIFGESNLSLAANAVEDHGPRQANTGGEALKERAYDIAESVGKQLLSELHNI
jgi:hypothetical protein